MVSEKQGSRGAKARGSRRAEGQGSRKPIRSHRELEVYQLAFEASMKIFEMTKNFPAEERYSLTDQIRRSSRSVCANLCSSQQDVEHREAAMYPSGVEALAGNWAQKTG